MSDALDPSPHDAAAPAEAGGSGLFDFYVEQLETYLDGELDEAEATVVRRRLAEEPAYAGALDRLHRARRLRVTAFVETCDVPEDAEAAERLRNAAHQMTVRARFEPPAAAALPHAAAAPRSINRWWIGSAVAACMVVAFGLGLYGQFDRGIPPAPIQSNPRTIDGGNLFTVSGDGTVTHYQKVDPDEPQPPVDDEAGQE